MRLHCRIATLLVPVWLCLLHTPSTVQAFGRIQPAFQPHYGCFGYCNGPINGQHMHWGCFGYCPGPIRPQPDPHWGCFGYCPGPIRPQPQPYWGCYGYCPGPINSYPVPVPYPVAVPAVPQVTDNTYVQSPSLTMLPPPQEVDAQGQPIKSVEDLIQDLSSKEARVRGEAVAALGRLGPKAKEAIPELLRALADRDANVRLEATLTLAKIGTIAVPNLRKALESQNAHLRMGAALALGHMGAEAKAAIPELKTALKDEKESVRCHAAQALFRIDPKSAALVVPVLAAALDSESAYVRQCALGTLSRMGPPAKDAVANLKKLLKSDDTRTRLAAAIAIGHIDPGQDVAAIDILRGALADPNVAMQIEAAQILGAIAAKAKAAVPELGKALRSEDAGLSRAAAVALSHMGRDAVPELVRAMDAKSNAVRLNAVAALAEIASGHKEALPALRNAAKDGDETVRMIATEALKHLDAGSEKK